MPKPQFQWPYSVSYKITHHMCPNLFSHKLALLLTSHHFFKNISIWSLPFFSIDKMCIIISLREVHWTRTTLKSWFPGLLVLRILWPRQHFVHDFVACWASAHHGPHQPIQPYPFSAFFSLIGWVHLCQLALFVCWLQCHAAATLYYLMIDAAATTTTLS